MQYGRAYISSKPLFTDSLPMGGFYIEIGRYVVPTTQIGMLLRAT